jgi:hypothetical protein
MGDLQLAAWGAPALWRMRLRGVFLSPVAPPSLSRRSRFAPGNARKVHRRGVKRGHPAQPDRAREPMNAWRPPRANRFPKAWRSLGSPTPDTAAGGHSPDVPVWRDGDQANERDGSSAPTATLEFLFSTVCGRHVESTRRSAVLIPNWRSFLLPMGDTGELMRS